MNTLKIYYFGRLFKEDVISYKSKLKGGSEMKKTYLQKQKRRMYFVLIFILTCILILSFFLNTYLLELQRKERMDKISDYTDYELMYEPQNRCQVKNKFTFEEYTYLFNCVDEVYLSYGSTKMTLEEALENHYLTFKDLTIGLVEEETDEELIYTHDKTKNSKGYQFIVNKLEKTVTFKGEEV